jgi:hypothetical protein
MGAIDMSVLAQMADPAMVVKAQKDPEVRKRMKPYETCSYDTK